MSRKPDLGRSKSPSRNLLLMHKVTPRSMSSYEVIAQRQIQKQPKRSEQAWAVSNIAVQDLLLEQSLQILQDTPEWRAKVPAHFKPVQLGHWASTKSATRAESIVFATPMWKLSHTAKVVLQCVQPKDPTAALRDPCFEMRPLTEFEFSQCFGYGENHKHRFFEMIKDRFPMGHLNRPTQLVVADASKTIFRTRESSTPQVWSIHQFADFPKTAQCEPENCNLPFSTFFCWSNPECWSGDARDNRQQLIGQFLDSNPGLSDLPKRLPPHLIAFLDGLPNSEDIEKVVEPNEVKDSTKSIVIEKPDEVKDSLKSIVIEKPDEVKESTKSIVIEKPDNVKNSSVETIQAPETMDEENSLRPIMNLQFIDRRRFIDLDEHAKVHQVPPRALNALKWIGSRRSVADMDRILRTIVIA